MFSLLSSAKPDPILSIALAFQQDERKDKLDLGIGVYKNDDGFTPIMRAVKQAQTLLAETQLTKSYVGLAGNENFNRLISEFILESTNALVRSATIQTPGASGALRMIADLIASANSNATVWMSDPSYINHRPVMEAAGLTVRTYPYIDSKTQLVDLDGMMAAFAQVARNDVVLLHACCHNPTGADLPQSAWAEIGQLAQKKGFIPFIDLAYHGLGDGLEEDLKGLRTLADMVEEMFIAYSCSKNFGLYRERTGAAVLIGKDQSMALKAKNKILQLARATYTMPPDHGAAIVDVILSNELLKNDWMSELDAMRHRMMDLRSQLTQSLTSKLGHQEFDFIQSHKGMFSMLGLNEMQINYLRENHGIYLVGDSRMNIAGLNTNSIDYLSHAMLDLYQQKI